MSGYEKDGFLGELIENAVGEEVLTLLEYKGRKKKISIPAKIDGVPVEFLCRTFLGNETVEEVRVPRGVAILGDEVFKGCTQLKKVSLSKTVREIGREVFHLCENLEEVAITAPNQVDIHHLAFDQERYPWNGEGFLIFDRVLFAYSGKRRVVHIPDGVEEVRPYAFSGGTVLTTMEELYFPNTVKKLQVESLQHCKALEILVLPEGVKKIPERSFISSKLTEIVIPSTVEELGQLSFFDCNALTHIQFTEPSSLKIIKANTFDCENLEEITLPSSVERVEREAFFGCVHLSSVTLSPTTQLEKGAFPYPEHNQWEFIHPKVVASYYDIDQSDYYRRQFYRWAKLKPDKQEEIKEGIGRYIRELDCCVDFLEKEDEKISFLRVLFQEKTEQDMDLFFDWGLSLTLTQFETFLNHAIQTGNAKVTAYLLQKKKEIYTQEEVDAYETRKEQVELGVEPATLEELSRRWYFAREEDGVVVTGYRGGSGREVLPSSSADGVKIVKVGAVLPHMRSSEPFDGLTFLEMGEGTCLLEKTFENSSLEEIRLPKNMEEIPFRAFANAPLKELEIPEGVERIGASAFSDTKLEEVMLPKSLKVMDESAFHHCTSLKKVVFRGRIAVIEPIVSKDAFDALERLITKTYFKRCPSLVFVGEEGGENQLERLKEEGVIFTQ